MTNHFTQAQAATVQDGGQTFCTPPANDVKPVRVPPAGSSLGECAHFDALGNALQVGDLLEHDLGSPGRFVTITELLSGPCFAYKIGKRRYIGVCRGYVRFDQPPRGAL